MSCRPMFEKADVHKFTSALHVPKCQVNYRRPYEGCKIDRVSRQRTTFW